MIDATEKPNSDPKLQQVARAKLRELFLKGIGELSGKLLFILIAYAGFPIIFQDMPMN